MGFFRILALQFQETELGILIGYDLVVVGNELFLFHLEPFDDVLILAND